MLLLFCLPVFNVPVHSPSRLCHVLPYRFREQHGDHACTGAVKDAELLIAQESKLCSHV